jgi:hypothetical protein
VFQFELEQRFCRHFDGLSFCQHLYSGTDRGTRGRAYCRPFAAAGDRSYDRAECGDSADCFGSLGGTVGADFAIVRGADDVALAVDLQRSKLEDQFRLARKLSRRPGIGDCPFTSVPFGTIT